MALNWYNINGGRTFPFQDGTVHQPGSGTIENLPNDIIVDAGFMAGTDAGFISGTHRIWLESIHRVPGPVFVFTFASDAPGLEAVALQFTRAADANEYLTEYAEIDGSVTSESINASETLIAVEPLFRGFLTTGAVSYLETLLPIDNTTISRVTGGGALIEPALIQNLGGVYVTSISLANDDRTRVTSVDGGQPIGWSHPTGGTYVQALQLNGSIEFIAGYNVTVTQDIFSNTITLGGQPGAGMGQLCDVEPTRFPGEVPPPNSSLLEGGPTCAQVIQTINGIGGTATNINGGAGVSIIPLPEQHTIIIDVNLLNLSSCANSSETSEISEAL